jgi:HSP20 family protein
MTIVRWEPLREFDRLFNSVFEGPGADARALRRWMPPMDLIESEGEFVLRADLPGLSEADVKIELEDSTLTIAGERKSESETERDGYLRVERATGTFQRSLTLPKGVDPEAVSASFDRGVLEVRIPKPEQRKPRRIEIAGAEPKTLEGSAA